MISKRRLQRLIQTIGAVAGLLGLVMLPLHVGLWLDLVIQAWNSGLGAFLIGGLIALALLCCVGYAAVSLAERAGTALGLDEDALPKLELLTHVRGMGVRERTAKPEPAHPSIQAELRALRRLLLDLEAKGEVLRQNAGPRLVRDESRPPTTRSAVDTWVEAVCEELEAAGLHRTASYFNQPTRSNGLRDLTATLRLRGEVGARLDRLRRVIEHLRGARLAG